MSKKSEQDRVVPFGQNPHAIRESRENNLELAIGHEVRTLRKKLGLTVTDLANATGISSGMLSKIENGNISPSLSSLQALSGALGIPLCTLPRLRGTPKRELCQIGRRARHRTAWHSRRTPLQPAWAHRQQL